MVSQQIIIETEKETGRKGKYTITNEQFELKSFQNITSMHYHHHNTHSLDTPNYHRNSSRFTDETFINENQKYNGSDPSTQTRVKRNDLPF